MFIHDLSASAQRHGSVYSASIVIAAASSLCTVSTGFSCREQQATPLDLKHKTEAAHRLDTADVLCVGICVRLTHISFTCTGFVVSLRIGLVLFVCVYT